MSEIEERKLLLKEWKSLPEPKLPWNMYKQLKYLQKLKEGAKGVR